MATINECSVNYQNSDFLSSEEEAKNLLLENFLQDLPSEVLTFNELLRVNPSFLKQKIGSLDSIQNLIANISQTEIQGESLQDSLLRGQLLTTSQLEKDVVREEFKNPSTDTIELYADWLLQQYNLTDDPLLQKKYIEWLVFIKTNYVCISLKERYQNVLFFQTLARVKDEFVSRRVSQFVRFNRQKKDSFYQHINDNIKQFDKGESNDEPVIIDLDHKAEGEIILPSDITNLIKKHIPDSAWPSFIGTDKKNTLYGFGVKIKNEIECFMHFFHTECKFVPGSGLLFDIINEACRTHFTKTQVHTRQSSFKFWCSIRHAMSCDPLVFEEYATDEDIYEERAFSLMNKKDIAWLPVGATRKFQKYDIVHDYAYYYAVSKFLERLNPMNAVICGGLTDTFGTVCSQFEPDIDVSYVPMFDQYRRRLIGNISKLTFIPNLGFVNPFTGGLTDMEWPVHCFSNAGAFLIKKINMSLESFAAGTDVSLRKIDHRTWCSYFESANIYTSPFFLYNYVVLPWYYDATLTTPEDDEELPHAVFHDLIPKFKNSDHIRYHISYCSKRHNYRTIYSYFWAEVLELADMRAEGAMDTIYQTINGYVKSLTDFVKNMATSAVENIIVDGINSYLPRVEKLISLLSCFALAFKLKDPSSFLLLIMSQASTLGVLSGGGCDMASHISKFATWIMGKSESFVKQSENLKNEVSAIFLGGRAESDPVDINTTDYSFMDMFGVITRMFGVRNASDAKKDHLLIKDFKLCFSTVKSVKELAIGVVDFIRQCVLWAYEVTYGVPYGQEQHRKLFEEITLWTAKTNEYLDDIANIKDQLSSNKTFLHVHHDHAKYGDDLAVKAEALRLKEHVPVFIATRTLYRNLVLPIVMFVDGKKDRALPTAVLVVGQPGTGKTGSANVLIKDLQNSIGETFDEDTSVYFNNSSEIWSNGYNGQFAFVDDDIFQRDETVAVTDEALSLIRIKNDAAFYPQMSESHEKHTIMFKSKLYLATSNSPTLPVNVALTSREAWWRRWDIILEQTIPDDFIYYKDGSKEILALSAMDMSVFRYRIYNWRNETYSEYKTYHEVFSILLQKFKKNQQKSLDLKKAIYYSQDSLLFKPSDYDELQKTGKTSFACEKYREYVTAQKEFIQSQAPDPLILQARQRIDDTDLTISASDYSKTPKLDRETQNELRALLDVIRNKTVFSKEKREIAKVKANIIYDRLGLISTDSDQEVSDDGHVAEGMVEAAKLMKDAPHRVNAFWLCSIIGNLRIGSEKCTDMKQRVACVKAAIDQMERWTDDFDPSDRTQPNYAYLYTDYQRNRLLLAEINLYLEREHSDMDVRVLIEAIFELTSASVTKFASIPKVDIDADFVYSELVEKKGKGMISDADPWMKFANDSLTLAIKVSLIAFSIWGLYKLSSYMSTDADETLRAEDSRDYQEELARKRRMMRDAPRTKIAYGGGLAQSDTNAAQLENCIHANAASIMYSTPDGTQRAQGFFVQGRVLVTVAHSYVQPWYQMTITTTRKQIIINRDERKFMSYIVKGKDVVFIHLDGIQEFRSLVEHFRPSLYNREDLTGANVSAVGFQSVRKDESGEPVLSGLKTHIGTITCFQPSAQYSHMGTTIVCDDFVLARVPGISGDCGRPYIMHNPNITHKLLGIHVSGIRNSVTDSSGICVITRDVVDEALRHLSMDRRSQLEILGSPMSDELQAEGFHGYIDGQDLIQSVSMKTKQNVVMTDNKKITVTEGAIPISTRIPDKTSIEPSLLYGLFNEHPVKTAPALLKKCYISDSVNSGDNTFISPIQIEDLQVKLPEGLVVPSTEAMKKFSHGIEPTRGDSRFHKQIMEKLLGQVAPHTDRLVGLVPLDIAINGLSESRDLPGLDMKKSSGCPQNMTKPKKSQFFSRIGEKYEMTYECELMLKKAISSVERDKLIDEYIVQAFMKDERRPIQKVVDGKTRIVNVFPFEILLLQKIFLGDFSRAVRENYMDSYTTVGLDPCDKAEWTNLFKNLTKSGLDANLFDGDHRAMDAHFSKSKIALFVEHVLSFYKKFDTQGDLEFMGKIYSFRQRQTIRERLLWHMFSAKVVFGNTIFQAFTNLSGSLFTTEINCFLNSYLFHDAVLETWYQKKIDLNFGYVIDSIFVTSAGDDTIPATPRDFGLWFSYQDMKSNFLAHGFELTMPDKSDITENSKPRTALTCTYTKRSFRLDERGFLYAPLDAEVLYDMVQWRTKNTPPLFGTRVNAINACREAYFHGQEFFEKFNDDVWRAMTKAGMVMRESDGFHPYWYYDAVYHGSKPTVSDYFDSKIASNYEDMLAESEIVVDEVPEGKDHTILSTLLDQAPPISQPPPITNVVMDPYDKLDRTTSSMKREYFISPTTWSGSDAFGARLATIDPLTSLMAIPHITDMVSDFRYLRAGCRVSFRSNFNPGDSGTIMIAMLPSQTPSVANAVTFLNIYRASIAKPKFLSAATGNVVTFEVPWTSPLDWVDRQDYVSGNYAGIIGVFALFVLNPLQRVGQSGTPVVIIQTTASFIEPELAGFITVNSNSELLGFDGGEAEGEQIQKSERGMMSGIAEDVSSIASALSRVPNIGVVAGQVAVVSKMISKTLSLFGLDKPTNVEVVKKMCPTMDDGVSFGKGLDNTNTLSFDPEVKVSLLQGASDNFQLYKSIPMLLRTATATGSTTISEIIMSVPVNPMYVSSVRFNDSLVDFQTTPVSLIASHHLFYRGGMKYMLFIDSSLFTHFKVRIVIAFNNGTTTIADNEAGDVLSTTIDVRGPTKFCFSVPYLKQMEWTAVNTFQEADSPSCPENNGRIIIQLRSLITSFSSLGSVTARFNLFACADSDFAVQRPVNPSQMWGGSLFDGGSAESDSTCPEMDDLQMIFSQKFESLIPSVSVIRTGGTISQEVSSWSEYLHRYMVYDNRNSDLTTLDPWTKTTTATDEINVPFFQIRNMFLYAKGTLRWKIFFPSTIVPLTVQCGNTTARETTVNLGSATDATLYGAGSVIEAIANKRIVAYETPFYSPVSHWTWSYRSFFSNYLPQSTVGSVPPGTNYPMVILMATGDDFSLSIPTGCPILRLAYPVFEKPMFSMAGGKRTDKYLFSKSQKQEQIQSEVPSGVRGANFQARALARLGM